MTSRKPDLLQVVLSLGAGGTERLVVDMCLALRDRANIGVVCLDDKGEWSAILEEKGIRVTALGRPHGFRLSIAAGVRAAAAGMIRPTLHCHHYTPFIYGALASLTLPGSTLVYTEHGRYGDGPPSDKRRIANKLFGRVPGHLFAVSHDLRQHMIGEGLPAGRLKVNHNGVAPGLVTSPQARDAVRNELGLAKQDWVLGTVARLDPVKDLGNLVQAIRVLAPEIPQLRLAVVGDGPEEAALKAAAEQSGAADRFVFTGHRDDARNLMAGFDAYVNCSVIEGISVTILEALAAGLPVLATQVGGTPEILGDDEFGLMFPSRSVSALVEAIRHLSSDTILGNRLRSTARQHVDDSFSVDTMLRQYVDAYGWS
jgi:L-malate glycosyltransferase